MRSGIRPGITLIELVMSIVVLAIAVPPLLFSLTKGASDAVLAERQSIAQLLAVEKMETIVADRHAAGRGYAYLATGNYAAENPVTGFASFSRSVAFADVAAADLTTVSAGSGYRKVTVTVSYTNPAGSYVLVCVFADL